MKPIAERIAELRANLRKDPVFKLLSSNSNLTAKQVETLLFDVVVEQYGARLTAQERAALRGVSKGAFVRTKKQAERNITKALFTVMLASYLGILRLPSYRWLLEIGELLQEGDVESLQRAVQVLSESLAGREDGGD